MQLENSYFNLVTPSSHHLKITNLYNKTYQMHKFCDIVVFKHDKKLKNTEKFIEQTIFEFQNY